jgi:hypothetical protein
MEKQPLPAALNGRSRNGQFTAGNKFGAGNPLNMKAQQLRNSLLQTVTEDDLTSVTKKLIAMAKEGNIHAIRELLDRVLGKPNASIELTQTEAKERIEDMSDEELLSIARAEGSRQ